MALIRPTGIKDLSFTVVNSDGSSTVIKAESADGGVTIGRDIDSIPRDTTLGTPRVNTSIYLELDHARGITSTHVPAPKCKATFWVNGVDGYACTKVGGHTGPHESENPTNGKMYTWCVS